MVKKLKEIIKIILFIKDIDMMTLSKNITVSYTALRNYLTYNSQMSISNVIEIFEYLKVPYTKAVLLASSDLDRASLIAGVIEEVKSNE